MKISKRTIISPASVGRSPVALCAIWVWLRKEAVGALPVPAADLPKGSETGCAGLAAADNMVKEPDEVVFCCCC